jgi:O-antigen ligase
LSQSVADNRPNAREILIALPAALFLAILPFRHTVALRVSLAAAVFVVALAIWRKAKSAIPPVPCRMAIGLWALTACVSLLYAVDRSNSWSEIKNEIGYAVLVFWSFYVLGHRDRFLPWAVTGLTLGATVLALLAVFLFVKTGSFAEVDLTIGSADLVTYIITAAPLTLLAWLWPSRLVRGASIVVLLLLFAAAFASQQRIAWPVLSLQAVLALIYLGYRRSGRAALAVCGLLVVSIPAVGSFLYYQVDVARAGDSDPDGSLERIVGDQRLQRLWKPVAETIGRSPLIGAGFGRHAMRKGHSELIPKDNPILWHAHNVILDYGLAMGIPGMLAIVLLFLCLGYRFFRLLLPGEDRLNMLGLAGLLVVTGVLLRNQVNDMFVRDNALLFWALNGLLLGAASSGRIGTRPGTR